MTSKLKKVKKQVNNIEAAAIALYEYDVNNRWQPDWLRLPKSDREAYIRRAQVVLVFAGNAQVGRQFAELAFDRGHKTYLGELKRVVNR